MFLDYSFLLQEAAGEPRVTDPMLETPGGDQTPYNSAPAPVITPTESKNQKNQPKKAAKPGVRSSRMVLCRVQLLDGSDFEVEIDVSL